MTERPLKTTLLPIYSKEEVELYKKNRLSSFRKRAEMIIFAIGGKIPRKETIPKRNTELTNENKATRVLAIVFVCFFICWTPFFGANLAVGFCGERCALPPTIASFFLWLGYFSSTINPLIYTIFNRQFRRTFLRIFRCQCTHSIQSTYVGNYNLRRTDNDDWATTDRSDFRWEQDRYDALSYNKNLDESSRQEHCVHLIQPDSSPPTTSRKIDLLEQNAQIIVNNQSQTTLKVKDLTWKGYEVLDICITASSEDGELSK
ncbi:unnamed protein product [Cercopithifilaria johnstoni]|uniref:G-protein coupled receptors family 1 profile domain-containing protein n=1 Tax=Cercopithifilaria johnstoni TaxID=2874296 RepID=A0A8J2M1C9_9BILA|nr:unnamed protein product [Cercopithifilaria johnstoni]